MEEISKPDIVVNDSLKAEYKERIHNKFRGLRLNYLRLLAMMSSQTINSQTHVDAFDMLCLRLNAVVQRTKYLDSIESFLLPNYFFPYEVWWFRQQFWTAFNNAVTYFGPSSYAAHSLCYFRIVESVVLNVHRGQYPHQSILAPICAVIMFDRYWLTILDCSEEYDRLIDTAVRTCDAMINNIIAHSISQLR
jgi:hypothetical protein